MELSVLTAQLNSSQNQLDRHIERLNLPPNQRVYCQKGCANCCSLVVNCSFVEAAAMARQLSDAQRKAVSGAAPRIVELADNCPSLKDFLLQYRATIGGCIFLDRQHQECSVYPERPLSCRALLSTRPSAWCGVDFSTLHPLEKEAFLSSLDRDIVNFPTHYLASPQERAGELEADLIWSLREQCGYAISGNLIYQLWLEQEHSLTSKLQTGDFDLAAYLHQQQLLQPLLLQVHKENSKKRTIVIEHDV